MKIRKMCNGGMVLKKGEQKVIDAKVIKEKVKGKNLPRVGQEVVFKYRIKDSDKIPAVLTDGEYVLSKKMIPKVKEAFKKAKMKPLKNL